MLEKLSKSLLMVMTLVVYQPAYCDWQLVADASSINFVSVKKGSVVESHEFKEIKGDVSAEGKLNLEINLASVETMIPIRNERMAKMLFETNTYASATLSADVPIAKLQSMAVGSSITLTIPANLSLHGKNEALSVEIIATHVASGVFQVSSKRAVILHADQFNLSAGIEALREIAGLNAITHTVPVNFSLVFRQ